MGSTIWLDSEGFEWERRCSLCDLYDRSGWDVQNNCRTNSNTKSSFRNQFCRSYETPLMINGNNEEPFHSYYNANKPHDCPNFECNDDD